jgi:glycosyltransferase involved in cell wall biosynthesis
MATEKVYIVIPVHSRAPFDTRDHLHRCVSTLRQYTDNFNIIFVDDYSDQQGSDSIAAQAAQFRESYIVRTQKQRWFTRAVNLGLRLVRTPWAVEANSDVVFYPGWLEELFAVRDEVQQFRKVGLVGSVYSADEQRRYDETQKPNYVTGHCWLLNMQAMEECAVKRGAPGWYLDETSQRNIHIFSDNQICYEMNAAGWSTIRAFKSAVGHDASGASWGHNLGLLNMRLEEVND